LSEQRVFKKHRARHPFRHENAESEPEESLAVAVEDRREVELGWAVARDRLRRFLSRRG